MKKLLFISLCLLPLVAVGCKDKKNDTNQSSSQSKDANKDNGKDANTDNGKDANTDNGKDANTDNGKDANTDGKDGKTDIGTPCNSDEDYNLCLGNKLLICDDESDSWALLQDCAVDQKECKGVGENATCVKPGDIGVDLPCDNGIDDWVCGADNVLFRCLNNLWKIAADCAAMHQVCLVNDDNVAVCGDRSIHVGGACDASKDLTTVCSADSHDLLVCEAAQSEGAHDQWVVSEPCPDPGVCKPSADDENEVECIKFCDEDRASYPKMACIAVDIIPNVDFLQYMANCEEDALGRYVEYPEYRSEMICDSCSEDRECYGLY